MLFVDFVFNLSVKKKINLVILSPRFEEKTSVFVILFTENLSLELLNQVDRTLYGLFRLRL